MDNRNRLGLYGSYLLGMVGIGFTLPYLPLYLQQQGLSISAIGWLSTAAALLSLLQFPLGLWSDRLGKRKPFLITALACLTMATFGLRITHGMLWLGILTVLFAENGICRALVESMAGAEAAVLAGPGKVGSALGVLRLWKPVGIVLMSLTSGWLAERHGIGSVLVPLAFLQLIALAAACLIREPKSPAALVELAPHSPEQAPRRAWEIPRDAGLWSFVAAMVLFHTANAPAGVYLGLFLHRDLHALNATLAYAFIVSMVVWMAVVWPAGWLTDRWGRRPFLLLAWVAMTARLVLIAQASSAGQVVAIQVLDGLANGLFAVVAAAWVTDRLADFRRVGEAQAIVGTSLVLGSAIGPALAALLVDAVGYRGLFGILAGVGAAATASLLCLVPETVSKPSASRKALMQSGALPETLGK